MANNLAEHMKNLEIEEPKFEKWNELPPEIKLECIKTLDFTTRCNLRSTCRLEKALVDSQKFHIDSFELCSDHMSQEIIIEHGAEKKYKEYDSVDEFIPSFQYITEHGIIEKLKIDVEYGHENLIDRLRPLPWTVKYMRVKCEQQKDLIFFLERLNEKVEKIKIDVFWNNQFSIDSILGIRQIINVPHLKITLLPELQLRRACEFAQLWIENDAKIGQQFDLYYDVDKDFDGSSEALEGFKKEFSSRIVSNKAENVRIRTDNPSKHILIQLGDLRDKQKDYDEMLHMTVIPADMKETEYDMKWYEELENRFNFSFDDFDLPDRHYVADDFDGAFYGYYNYW